MDKWSKGGERKILDREAWGGSLGLQQAEDLNEESERALWIYEKNILEEGRISTKH